MRQSAFKLVQTGIFRTSSLPDSFYALSYVCIRDVVTHEPSADFYCKLFGDSLTAKLRCVISQNIYFCTVYELFTHYKVITAPQLYSLLEKVSKYGMCF